MSDLHKKRLFALVVLVCCVGISLPVIFGHPRVITDQSGGDWLRNLIFDFQTLITGFAAVLAAGYTVRQMIRSDEKQDRRHKEAMAFAMRGETRRMDRGLHPQLEHLRKAAEKLAAEWVDFEDFEGQQHGQYRWFSGIILPLNPILYEIVEILERSTIRDAAEIFDGALLLRYEKATEDANNIKRWFSRHIEANSFSEMAGAIDFHHYENFEWDEEGVYRVAITRSFPHRLASLIKEMESAADELARLRSRFDIG